MEIGNVKCDLLLSKRDAVRNENVISVPMTHLSEDYITKRKEQTQQMIETLNRLFPESELREVTILEERLVAQGGEYGYGRAVRTSDSSAAVFVDKSFWESPSLAHELVHAYMNYNYEQIAARYFFDEALIESITYHLRSTVSFFCINVLIINSFHKSYYFFAFPGLKISDK